MTDLLLVGIGHMMELHVKVLMVVKRCKEGNSCQCGGEKLLNVTWEGSRSLIE